MSSSSIEGRLFFLHFSGVDGYNFPFSSISYIEVSVLHLYQVFLLFSCNSKLMIIFSEMKMMVERTLAQSYFHILSKVLYENFWSLHIVIDLLSRTVIECYSKNLSLTNLMHDFGPRWTLTINRLESIKMGIIRKFSMKLCKWWPAGESRMDKDSTST